MRSGKVERIKEMKFRKIECMYYVTTAQYSKKYRKKSVSFRGIIVYH